MLGLATKAGKTVFGAESVAKGVKSGKILLVLADHGLSERSMKDTTMMCSYYHTPLIVPAESGAAGAACGKPAIRLIGITDRSFATQLIELREYAEVQH